MGRWVNTGAMSGRARKYSIYRYSLEAITPEGLTWCGSYKTAKRAYNEQFRIRQDWEYQVYDGYLDKVIEKEIEHGNVT